jgi:hypothetical protein
VRGRTPAHRDDHHRPEDRHGETQGRPDGANYDSFEGSNVYLTAAFADLPGPKKQAVAQEAAYAFQDGLTPKEKAKIENTCSGTPVNVLDHLGRLVYTMHPCHQDFKGLTDGFFALDFKYRSRLVRHAGETIRIGANPAIFG